MPRVEFEHTILAFEGAKTFHVLDRAVTVIANFNNTEKETQIIRS
jgi:hypothetical protein